MSIALIFAALPAGAVRADEAEEALEKYRQPLDQSIDQALAWLAKQQQPNGSFPGGRPVAVTGLAVMAFLAKGNTPGDGPYGDVINKGVDFILTQQDQNGWFPQQMYDHGIATLLLSEVSGMVDDDRQAKIDPALAKAMKLILDAQKVRKAPNQQGGWRYGPGNNDSDISCTGWALMALRSARNNGAEVPRRAIEQAVQFVLHCRMPDGGFAYQPGGGSGLARTGTALLCLELCGKHRDAACIGAGDWILKNLPANFGETFFYYALYYTAQGTFQLGGMHWTTFATHLYEMMFKFQQADGHWPAGSSHEAQAGPCYSTAMAVLAMSVTYRQLPIYQR